MELEIDEITVGTYLVGDHYREQFEKIANEKGLFVIFHGYCDMAGLNLQKIEVSTSSMSDVK